MCYEPIEPCLHFLETNIIDYSLKILQKIKSESDHQKYFNLINSSVSLYSSIEQSKNGSLKIVFENQNKMFYIPKMYACWSVYPSQSETTF